MKTRFGGLVAACALMLSVLSGCVGQAAVGDGTESDTSSASETTGGPEFSVACPEWSNPAAYTQDGQMPVEELECLGDESQSVAMSGEPGLPTVVNLWATWCQPCRAEIPVLEEFAQLADGKVAVLGVVTRDSASNAQAFAAEYDVSFPSVLDPDSTVATSMALQALPNSVLVDSDGSIVSTHIGPFTSLEQIVALVEEQFGVTI